VGSWKREACEFPYGDASDVTFESPLHDSITFYPDGSIGENGYYSYCCTDECDTAFGGTCTWNIENGSLYILPDQPANYQQLNQQFPIMCLSGDNLVFDNVLINNATRKKACYSRQ